MSAWKRIFNEPGNQNIYFKYSIGLMKVYLPRQSERKFQRIFQFYLARPKLSTN